MAMLSSRKGVLKRGEGRMAGTNQHGKPALALFGLVLMSGFAILSRAGSFLDPGETPQPSFTLPPGFVIEKVAGPPLFEHPMWASFDQEGRLFVADSAGLNLKADDLLKEKPHRIRVLDPAGSDGRFTRSQVWADQISLPNGVLWHDGAVYAAAPPSFWRFEDTTGKGMADRRTELVTKFGFNGNACDIHGPVLGPDGWLYWCDGRHGYQIQCANGQVLKSKASGILRCRPDGTDIEVVIAGGMDNPVEVAFTAEGEPLATVNILHNKPARNDGILYAIEGGNFPWHDYHLEWPRTGDLLPAIADLGWVAPSGLMRYQSEAFGKGYQDNFFSAQFNRNRIQRHVVVRQGASFKVQTEDFLTCSDKNFHPTDVLEDADGSLLVLDTGGWFRIGCPTSKIAQPEIKGAIYRIRKLDAPRIEDPRGLNIPWAKLSPGQLTGYLDDERFLVRDRAIGNLAKRANDAVPALVKILASSPSTRSCRNAVWALTRIDTLEARAAVRGVLKDRDPSVRLAAVHSAGLHRDERAFSQLETLVVKDEIPAVRRQAATALGRLAKPQAVNALMEGLRTCSGDRFLEHALIFALIRINQREGVAPYLRDPAPAVRRGALIALDQMPGGNLAREEVTPLLNVENATLQQAALNVIASRPGWGSEIVGLLRDWLSQPELDAPRQEAIRGVLMGMAKDSAIQDLTTAALQDAKTSTSSRLLILETLPRAGLDKFPPAWAKELGRALSHSDPAVVRQAISVLRAVGLIQFDEALTQLARDENRPTDIRLPALAAAAPRMKSMDEPLLTFLLDHLQKDRPPLERLTAAGALGQIRLSGPQLGKVVSLVAEAGPLELPSLLLAFEKGTDTSLGHALAIALDKSPGLSSLSVGMVKQLFRSYPAEVQAAAEKLIHRLETALLEQRTRLVELESLLKGGDETRGQLVFYGPKAACGTCHLVNNRGGKVGPDLSKIGAVRSARDLLEAVVFPSVSFARGYEPYVVETRAGQVHTGILGRETAEALYLVNAERAEIRIPRRDIETLVPGRVSIMPQGLDVQLSPQEMRDLLGYLQALR